MNRLLILEDNSYGYIATRALSRCIWRSRTDVLIIMPKSEDASRMFDLMCKYGHDVAENLITFQNHSTMQFIQPHEFDHNNSKYHTVYIIDLLTDFSEQCIIHICKNLLQQDINIYAQSKSNPNKYRNGKLIKILKYLEFII